MTTRTQIFLSAIDELRQLERYLRHSIECNQAPSRAARDRIADTQAQMHDNDHAREPAIRENGTFMP